jgi:hypothetical protein|tara:strand:+ start:1341 stop:1631 length:291 start_codon:yes stop_codon:yes gene_type:complete
MFNVSIEFEGHRVTGWADLCGPYAEIEGSEITLVSPPNNDEAFLERAMDAIVSDAYEQHKARHGVYRDPDYMDYDDHHQVGPDYWIDPESGEYRCG